MKKIQKIEPYYVIKWDINHNCIEKYDIIPYFISEYKKIKKNKPKEYDEVKTWLISEARYQFWARCQYEIVITGFPDDVVKQKIDVYYQIEMNIDSITKHFLNLI